MIAPMLKRLIPFLAAYGTLLCLSMGQDRLLTLDELYDPDKKINFSGSYPTGLQWLDDGLHYIHPGDEDRPYRKVDALSGETKVVFSLERLTEAFIRDAGFSEDRARKAARRGHCSLSPLQETLLVNFGDDLFLYQILKGRLVRLTNDEAREKEAAFSPSGGLVAFVKQNNLYVVRVGDGKEIALTRDGSADVLNGILDWVYQEEVFGRGSYRAFWWSPDSERLAFLRLDESDVPDFTVVGHHSTHLDLAVTKYPKAGDPNPRVTLGVVSVSDGQVHWVDLSWYEPEDLLIVSVSWLPDSSKVVFQVQDRRQTWLDLDLGDAATGKMDWLLRESSNAWVDVLASPYWLVDGSFLWQSNRTGFRHLYHYSAKGQLLRAITSGGDWEIRQLEAVDERQRVLYFSATRDSPREMHLFSVALDGRELKRISEEAGYHKVAFNRTATHYLDEWSDLKSPPQVRLHDAKGRLVRKIAENQVEILDEYRWGETEFCLIPASDGFMLPGLMIKPTPFEPGKRYPVLCYTYGGPHSSAISSQKVWNRWGGRNYLWHQMLAQKGYVIWICDVRTSSGKGVESAWPVYLNLGRVELGDLEEMVSWLKRQPFVDGDRIGLWGWSYGGFLTAYALTHSSSFKMGIAGAPVTDWSLYDTIYTERYMGLPEENRRGYEQSSVLEAAAALEGRLLLIHGGIDDNVHAQNTFQLADRLQQAGKSFELMIYPRSRHSVRDPLRLKHLRELMTEFILRSL